MYVCVCNKVTDHEIRRAFDAGVDTMDKLCRELQVGSCCGRCKDCAVRLLNEARAEQYAFDGLLALA